MFFNDSYSMLGSVRVNEHHVLMSSRLLRQIVISLRGEIKTEIRSEI